MTQKINIFRVAHSLGAQLGGEGGKSSIPFFENRKKCTNFGK